MGGQNIPVTDILFELVQCETGIQNPDGTKKIRPGVCTDFLFKLPIGHFFLSYHHANAEFKMPDDPNIPLLMVSAGSGIGPFRSFWQQRSLLHWPRENAWLYFGCRDSSENMFDEETSKVVQRSVAFSRLPDKPKNYVQDLLTRNGAHISEIVLNQKAHIFICGKVRI